ncbi:SDR family NAD(P)-dependent oxidoreductase [Helicobacter sp. MIT 14-3879]|uniref:SDR family NAD(P)-dependent oxidoreductase n=1 Tax=Helicobacter sp. MIT 14-3879 TaxID=2040649 RepID=UPI000E1E2CEC|nr:SDR family NAD(P)-dependent oxidoreductase [Helicobacter sp. MIT 14-3879]RDU60838.1 NAD(P)-dependent oxidoreductase [Helicobacter sp. MIT 14-3879]
MIALITGASVGFGRAIAKKFVKENHKVIALARREDKLRELQNELGNNNCEIIGIDVCNTNKIKERLDSLRNNFRNIDVLVNNAGLALGLSSASEADILDWERMIEVNILSLVRLTHLLLPQMVAQKRGHIINIGSIAGSYPYPGGNVYGASKAFVKQFSLNLRADLFDKNIRVSNIEPGLSGGSEFSLVRFKGDNNAANKVYENTDPLLPEDIADAVFWVANQPQRVNINRIELMPTTQAPSTLNVYKNK